MYDLNKLIFPGQNVNTFGGDIILEHLHVNTFGSTPHRVNVHTDWYVRY
jgi:hypothetical protein